LGIASLLLAILGVLSLAGCGGQATETPLAQVTDTPAPTATTRPTYTPTATTRPTRTPTQTPRPSPTATPRPTVTPIPPGANLLALESYVDGNGEIYLWNAETGALANLTDHPADDRAPAWMPAGGGAIAFESHRDGNWEIYVLNLADGSLTRLTENVAYDGAPAWSPDGTEIAFESYRDGNLEIYVVAVGGGEPRRLTDHAAGDYGPAWRPDGTEIAFTSWRDGNKEIYVMPSRGGEARNVTQHPADDEAPAWAPGAAGEGVLAFVSWRDEDGESGNRNAEIYQIDLEGGEAERLTDNPWPDLDPAWDAQGRLAWAAYEPGPVFETYDPYRPGDYHLYRQDPMVPQRAPERLGDGTWDERQPAPAPAEVPRFVVETAIGPPARPAGPTPLPTLAAGELAEVVQVPGILASYTEAPILVNELVAPSLLAWQQDLIEASGWDFLHTTLGAWRSIDQVRKREMYVYDYGYLSWHKAGRALDLALEYKVEGQDQLLQVREDLGEQTYWRLYLRTAEQDGSQGEPLKEHPWRYWWHIVPEEEPEAYDAGGKRLPIPAGYYVDVTALAKRHGWERIAAYQIEGDYHWSSDSNGTEYWHYERADSLTWWQAMQQLYTLETLEAHVGWEIGLERAQSEEMMRSKGVPSPEP
jgi:TolB protein